MGTRREARRWAVQLLFQFDFNKEELGQALADFWEEKEPKGDAREFVEGLVQGVRAHLPEIDEKIKGYAVNWELHRMSAVDRNIMRLAMFEMFYRTDIPPVVSINEAVDIAKEFSGPESGRFVNGILDHAREDLDRPARTTIEYPPAAGTGAGKEE